MDQSQASRDLEYAHTKLDALGVPRTKISGHGVETRLTVGGRLGLLEDILADSGVVLGRLAAVATDSYLQTKDRVQEVR